MQDCHVYATIQTIKRQGVHQDLTVEGWIHTFCVVVVVVIVVVVVFVVVVVVEIQCRMPSMVHHVALAIKQGWILHDRPNRTGYKMKIELDHDEGTDFSVIVVVGVVAVDGSVWVAFIPTAGTIGKTSYLGLVLGSHTDPLFEEVYAIFPTNCSGESPSVLFRAWIWARGK
jgi:hypothetical protein